MHRGLVERLQRIVPGRFHGHGERLALEAGVEAPMALGTFRREIPPTDLRTKTVARGMPFAARIVLRAAELDVASRCDRTNSVQICHRLAVLQSSGHVG